MHDKMLTFFWGASYVFMNVASVFCDLLLVK